MEKEDNNWYIEFEEAKSDDPNDWGFQRCCVNINGREYWMKEDLSGLTHALLLLVDAVNDKRAK